MMNKKICLVSDLHLSSNPRVWKEANALAAAGYEVSIITMWTSAEKRNKDNSFIHHNNISYKAGLNLIPGEINFIKRFCLRAWAKLMRTLKKTFNLNSGWCLGYAPGLMTNAVLKEKAALYIVHTEYGIMIGRKLLLKGKKVAFDIEDWYSRDYLVPERPVKLLQALEKAALQKGQYCSCPSLAMAAALNNTYPGCKKAEAIYNGFSSSENACMENIVAAVPSIVWFSQTIGEGRGLETAIESLYFIDTIISFHLIGETVAGYEIKLKKIFPFEKGHRLFFHGVIHHKDLIPSLSTHTIGLAIENNYPDNRNKTVTNKILQYIQAGIKVMATETDGQQEIAAYFPETVAIVPVNEPSAWAVAIQQLVDAADVDKEEQLRKFNQYFSWEAQEQKLLSFVKNALKD